MHDYEPDREDGLCSIRKMLKEAKGIGDFLGEMRDRKLVISDLFPILLKIMMSLVVSADISRKVTAVTQVRRCLAV